MSNTRSLIVVAASALAVLFTAPVAGADEPSDNERNHVALNLGWGSAVGFAGATYDRAIIDHLQLQGGLGLGYTGVQLAAMAQFVFPLWRRFGLSALAGAGPSLSMRRSSPRKVRTWGNAELGWQVDRGGFFMQMAGGVTVLVRGQVDAPCIHCDLSEYPGDAKTWKAGHILPAVRAAYGVRF